MRVCMYVHVCKGELRQMNQSVRECYVLIIKNRSKANEVDYRGLFLKISPAIMCDITRSECHNDYINRVYLCVILKVITSIIIIILRRT